MHKCYIIEGYNLYLAGSILGVDGRSYHRDNSHDHGFCIWIAVMWARGISSRHSVQGDFEVIRPNACPVHVYILCACAYIVFRIK